MLTDLIHRLTRLSNKDIFVIDRRCQVDQEPIQIVDWSLEMVCLSLGVESMSRILITKITLKFQNFDGLCPKTLVAALGPKLYHTQPHPKVYSRF